jgi:hypothetical protein
MAGRIEGKMLMSSVARCLMIGLLCSLMLGADIGSGANSFARGTTNQRALSGILDGTWVGQITRNDGGVWNLKMVLKQTGSLVQGTDTGRTLDGVHYATFRMRGTFVSNVLQYGETTLVARDSDTRYGWGPVGSVTLHFSSSGGIARLAGTWIGGVYSGTISVSKTFRAPAPGAATTGKYVSLLYPTGNAGLPPNSPVRFAWKPFANAHNYLLHIWIVKQSGSVPITPTTRVTLSTLVYGKTTYTWNDRNFPAGTYAYAVLPLDADGNALAPWSPAAQMNIYNS